MGVSQPFSAVSPVLVLTTLRILLHRDTKCRFFNVCRECWIPRQVYLGIIIYSLMIQRMIRRLMRSAGLNDRQQQNRSGWIRRSNYINTRNRFVLTSIHFVSIIRSEHWFRQNRTGGRWINSYEDFRIFTRFHSAPFCRTTDSRSRHGWRECIRIFSDRILRLRTKSFRTRMGYWNYRLLFWNVIELDWRRETGWDGGEWSRRWCGTKRQIESDWFTGVCGRVGVVAVVYIYYFFLLFP